MRGWLESRARAAEPWAITVSGGVDSLGMLLLLWAHFPKNRKRMFVLHYDHATRFDSAEDAQFVGQLSKDLGLEFATARRPVTGPASEQVLRDARWIFFRREMEARKAFIIFTGHQRDDIAETMLMRLARGSGAAGLCAPRPVQDFADGVFILRPLLDIPRHELRAALESAGVPWHEDSSNVGQLYLRNRIRHQVIPVMRSVLGARDLDQGAARSRAALQDDDDALRAITDSVYGELLPGEPLPLARFEDQPPAIMRRALWRWLNQNEVKETLNANAIQTLLMALLNRQPGRWSAGPGRWLVLSESTLSLAGADTNAMSGWSPVSFKPGATVELPNGAKLASRVATVDKKLLERLQRGKINPAVTAWLALPKKIEKVRYHARPWQAGDRYRPLGAPGSRKLQDLFTDKKIPLKERRLIPIVCNEDDEPLWAPGLPPAHTARVTPATRQALELTYAPR